MDPADLAPWGSMNIEGRLSGGNRNEVWAVSRDEVRFVARVTNRSTEALAWELDLLAWLRSSGVQTPRVVPTRDDRLAHAGITVFEWVEGRAPEGRRDWVAVREYLARLHALTQGWPQRPGFLSAGDLLVQGAGGDVDLSRLPAEAVTRCRTAWGRTAGRGSCVVHGDPGASNIFVTDGGVVLIDWDEARVDVSLFDLAALPDDVSHFDEEERWIAHQAASAWEAAVSWTAEPSYARRRLAEVANV